MFRNILKLLDEKQKLTLYLMIALSFLSSFLEAIGIASIYPVIRILLDDSIMQNTIYIKYLSSYITTKNDLVLFSLIAIFFIFLTKNIAVYSIKFIHFHFAKNLKYEIFQKLSRGILYLPYSKLANKTTDESIRNFNYVHEFPGLIQMVLVVITEALLMFMIIGFLVTISPNIVFFVLLTLSILMFFIYNNQKRIFYNLGKIYQSISKKNFSNIIELIGGMREIKIMKKENIFIKKISKTIKKLNEIRLKSDLLLQLPNHLIEVLVITTILIVLFTLHKQDLDKVELVSILGAFAIAFARLMPSSTRILASLNSIKYNLPVAKILLNQIDEGRHEDKFQKKVSEKNINFKKEIVIKDLTFIYKNKIKILSNLNLKISKGGCIGIYGGSGEGKTTLNNIISGLLVPTSGKVTIDNVDINKENTNWKKKVAYISQKPFFLNDTLKNNITFLNDKKINYKKIKSVIKKSGLNDFVKKLPKKLDSVIGERGSTLSAGQLQRVSIARALYSDSELIICDEATSSLDENNSKNILENIKNLNKSGKTIVIISHNKSTFYFCDKIYQIKNKKLIRSN